MLKSLHKLVRTISISFDILIDSMCIKFNNNIPKFDKLLNQRSSFPSNFIRSEAAAACQEPQLWLPRYSLLFLACFLSLCYSKTICNAMQLLRTWHFSTKWRLSYSYIDFCMTTMQFVPFFVFFNLHFINLFFLISTCLLDITCN